VRRSPNEAVVMGAVCRSPPTSCWTLTVTHRARVYAFQRAPGTIPPGSSSMYRHISPGREIHMSGLCARMCSPEEVVAAVDGNRFESSHLAERECQ
jgi:hypothetical protein